MVRTRSDQRRWCQNQRSSRPIRLKCTSVASRWLQERQRATGYAAAAPGRRAPAGPKPLVFGAGKNRGLRLKPGKLELEVVTLGEAGVTPDDVLVHEETNRALATLLVGLEPPAFPVALGVLYCHPAPSFEAEVHAQTAAAGARRSWSTRPRCSVGRAAAPFRCGGRAARWAGEERGGGCRLDRLSHPRGPPRWGYGGVAQITDQRGAREDARARQRHEAALLRRARRVRQEWRPRRVSEPRCRRPATRSALGATSWWLTPPPSALPVAALSGASSSRILRSGPLAIAWISFPSHASRRGCRWSPPLSRRIRSSGAC